jgi:DNA-binding GntR family transcriptional regulator
MAEQASLTNDSVKIARISKRFDSIVHKTSGNTRLFNLIDIVYSSGAIHREIILKSPGVFEESIKIPKAVIDSLEKKNGKATERAGHRYVRRSKEKILTH